MRTCALAVSALVAVLIAGCGGGGLPPGAVAGPAPISISISPVSTSVQLGATRLFTATLQGGPSTGPGGASFVVQGGAANGMIDANGLYTAPLAMPAIPFVNIIATSIADSTKTATATVSLTQPTGSTVFPVLFDVVTQGAWQAVTAPVTTGVPLPRAGITNVNDLRVQTQSGVNIATQFRVTSRWDDGSIRWVLCDFIADLSGSGGIGRYRLNNGGSGTAPNSNLVVLDGPTNIEVRTGQLTYSVSKTAFQLFDSILIDRDNDGVVDDECLNTAVERGIVLLDGVNEFRTDQAPPTRVDVEESGPVRVTLVVEGVHTSTTGPQGKLHYIMRLTSWVNLPFIKVAYTFKNMTGHGVTVATPADAAAQLAQVTTADGLYLDLPLQLSSASASVLLAGNPNPLATQTLSGAEHVELTQNYTGTHDAFDANNPQPPGFNAGTGDGSSVPLENTWPDQSDALIAYNISGKLTASGERSPGWVQVAGNQLRMTVAVREFWQNYPKQLRAQGDGLVRVGLWPSGTWPMQVFAGAMKTHEVLLAFDRLASVDQVGAQLRSAIINDPPLVVFNPDYNSSTGVYGRIGITNGSLSDLAAYPASAQTHVQNYMAQVVAHLADIQLDRSTGNGTATGHEYGMWNYGDGKTHLPEAGWENNDWEISRAALSWHAASGNVALARLFDTTVRHFRDVDVLHANIGLRFVYTEPGNPAVSGGFASQLGKTRYSPNNKQHDLGNFHLGENHLDVFKGAFLAEHYLLTGDALSLDVLREINTYLLGSWRRYFDAGNGGVDSRLTCPTTWLSNALYIATAYEMAAGLQDANAAPMRAFVLAAVRARQNALLPNDPQGNGFSDANGDFKAWQIGHMLEALEYTRGVSADATIDDNILRAMNWMFGLDANVYLGNPPASVPGEFGEVPGDTNDFGGPNLMIGAGFAGAYAASTDNVWRSRALSLLNAQTPKISLAQIGTAGVRHSTFAQFFRAGPLILGSLRQ